MNKETEKPPIEIIKNNAAAAGVAIPNVIETIEQMRQIEEAIRGYHFALDMRQNGGASAHLAIDAIQKILGMEWRQGDELKRRQQPAKSDENP